MQYDKARTARGSVRRIGACLFAAAAVAGCADAAREVAGPAGAPPAEAVATVGYTAVVGDDWKAYRTREELRAQSLFWWFRTGDVYQYVDLAPDATFGQVARITFQQSDETGYAPKIDAAFPAPLDRMWYRWRMRYEPGWTTVGPLPTGYANSYKVAFWLWDGYEGRGQVELSNTDEYILGFGVNQNGTYLNYTETLLPGSQSFGRVTTEWSDSQWWEFVVYYEKTGATTARQHWWRRRLTTGGAVAPGPWTYRGIAVSGATTPRVRGITLGANKNKNNPTTMRLNWGPWEVVDGSKYPNPWNMPNVSGGSPAPAPSLVGVDAAPDSARLAPGATQQFTAAGRYSDGTSRPVSVAWSATGGTVTSAGLYTAPQADGTYLVVAREGTSGRADTSRVTVRATTIPLLGVDLTPGSATVAAGATRQFTATGRYGDGTSRPVGAAWSATGGTVSSSGLYTAGATAGSFRVIASFGGRADTAAVSVTVPSSPGGSYARLAGDDWRAYASASQLSAYYSSGDLARVSLAADPVFGQVVRITQAAGSTSSPRLTRALPAPASRVWYRWRARFSPGWSTGGGGWTMAQWTWSGHNGLMSAGFSGTSHALTFNVRDAAWRYLNYAETQLSGSTSWGGVGTQFSDGEWYEYVMLWDKTGATTARAHWWTRRLTTGGRVESRPWTYYGTSLSGSTTPQVGAVSLGAGNLSRAPAAAQHVFWGPWEVVDGTRYANPFGMPGT